MAPTRELAQQIDQQMEGFSYFMPVSSVAVYGGNDGILFEQQKKGLTLGADVVIATPGKADCPPQFGICGLVARVFFYFGRSRPHARHGLLRRYYANCKIFAQRTPDHYVLCHHAGKDTTVGKEYPERPGRSKNWPYQSLRTKSSRQHTCATKTRSWESYATCLPNRCPSVSSSLRLPN